LDCIDPISERCTGKLEALDMGNMAFWGLFPSLWQLFPSEDWVWQWYGCLDHRDPRGDRYAGKLAVTSAGDMLLLKSFSSLWQLSPSEYWVWWCCGFLDCGDLSSARCAVKPAAVSTEDITLLESFSSLYQLALKKVFLAGPSLFCNVSETQRSTLMESFSIGQLLAPACWDRVATEMAPPSVHDSAVALCLPGCSAFLQRHSVLQSPPSCLLQPSSWSQQQSLHWDCSPVSRLQLPAAAHSSGRVSLSGVCRPTAQIACVVLTPFIHRSAASLSDSLKHVYSVPTDCPDVGISSLLQFPNPLGADPVPAHSPPLFLFLLSSYCVLCGSIFSFPVVRDSCWLLAGRLRDSWYLISKEWTCHSVSYVN